jgi:acetylornithine deacetylase/succinyl-diaminopimelate desuccinylase-like protein
LTKAIADPAVSVTPASILPPPVPMQSLDSRAMTVITAAAASDVAWRSGDSADGARGTDGVAFRALGIPAFAVNHFGPDDDVRAHGRDERIGVREFEDAVRFGEAAVRVAGGGTPAR